MPERLLPTKLYYCVFDGISTVLKHISRKLKQHVSLELFATVIKC